MLGCSARNLTTRSRSLRSEINCSPQRCSTDSLPCVPRLSAQKRDASGIPEALIRYPVRIKVPRISSPNWGRRWIICRRPENDCNSRLRLNRRCHVPLIAKRVFHSAAAVPVRLISGRLDGCGSGIQRSPVPRVHIFHMQQEHAGHGLPCPVRFAHLQHRIANANRRVMDNTIRRGVLPRLPMRV